MTYRRHGSKASIALWTLVAVTLLAAAAGPVAVLLVALTALILGGGVLATRMMNRPEPQPVKMVARRRW